MNCLQLGTYLNLENMTFSDTHDKSACEPLASAEAYAIIHRGVGGSPALGLSLLWQGGN